MKKWLSILMAAVIAVLAAACGTPGPNSKTAEVPVPASPARESSGQVTYPVTVTDQLGRQVTINEEPETIVSGYYISTSLLIALNCQDRLVGVEAKAGDRAIYHLSASAITALPSVGTAKEFDLEGCAALDPDLIILPAKLKDVIPALEDLGFTVLAVKPENQDLLSQAAVLLGTAVNTRPASDALLDFMNKQLSNLKNALAGTDFPSVYLAGNSSFLSTASPEMYQNSLIENAGGTNAASELTEDYWSEISYEQLLSWNPEYIVLASDASYSIESVLTDPNLAQCDAVKEGRVYQLPDSIEAWDSPVPGSFLGSLYLASILHPENYTREQFVCAATEFYETFYRFTPESELLTAPQ